MLPHLFFQKHSRKIHFVIICWVESISREKRDLIQVNTVFECLIIKHDSSLIISSSRKGGKRKFQDEEECLWVRKTWKIFCCKAPKWAESKATMRKGWNEKWRSKSGFDDGFPRENLSLLITNKERRRRKNFAQHYN